MAKIPALICNFKDSHSIKTRLEHAEILDKSLKLLKISTVEIALPLLSHPPDSTTFNIQFMEKSNFPLASHVSGSLIRLSELEIRKLVPSFPSDLYLPLKYERYDNFLMFPETAFTSLQWMKFIIESSNEKLFLIFQIISKIFKVEYIARKTRIPPFDILRRPHLTWLLHPLLPRLNYSHHLSTTPSTFDTLSSQRNNISTRSNVFARGVWTRTVQNGAIYIWSPEHSMFCPGNITEKTRVIKFDLMGRRLLAPLSHPVNPRNIVKKEVVLDLYAGIGYFTLAYILSGRVSTVYACEWNEWSVEGLKRGLEANKITYFSHKLDSKNRVVGKDVECEDEFENENGKVQVVICEGNNEDYVRVYKRKVDRVNLGLIPSSKQGWKLAVCALRGNGWVHVHMNVDEGTESEFKSHLIEEFERLFLLVQKSKWKVTIEHSERVKSFKPHVYHWVFDVYCTQTEINF